jgi:hypothetical protein
MIKMHSVPAGSTDCELTGRLCPGSCSAKIIMCGSDAISTSVRRRDTDPSVWSQTFLHVSLHVDSLKSSKACIYSGITWVRSRSIGGISSEYRGSKRGA